MTAEVYNSVDDWRAVYRGLRERQVFTGGLDPGEPVAGDVVSDSDYIRLLQRLSLEAREEHFVRRAEFSKATPATRPPSQGEGRFSEPRYHIAGLDRRGFLRKYERTLTNGFNGSGLIDQGTESGPAQPGARLPVRPSGFTFRQAVAEPVSVPAGDPPLYEFNDVLPGDPATWPIDGWVARNRSDDLLYIAQNQQWQLHNSPGVLFADVIENFGRAQRGDFLGSHILGDIRKVLRSCDDRALDIGIVDFERWNGGGSGSGSTPEEAWDQAVSGFLQDYGPSSRLTGPFGQISVIAGGNFSYFANCSYDCLRVTLNIPGDGVAVELAEPIVEIGGIVQFRGGEQGGMPGESLNFDFAEYRQQPVVPPQPAVTENPFAAFEDNREALQSVRMVFFPVYSEIVGP